MKRITVITVITGMALILLVAACGDSKTPKGGAGTAANIAAGRALKYQEQGEFDLAIAEYDRAIGMKPDFAVAYMGRAAAYEKKGELDRALEDLERAMGIDPDKAMPYIVRGHLYDSNGEPDKALADFDRAISMDLNNTAAYLARAALYIKKGDGEKAVADLETALIASRSPSDDAMTGLLLKAAIQLRDKDAAAAQAAGRSFIDSRDNQIYRAVKIGGLTWMARNLNIKTDGSWCYENNESNCQKYGRLYTWDAAMKACPAGWRLPDTADWNDLVEAAGGDVAAGRKLRSRVGWVDLGEDRNKNTWKDRYIASDGTDDFGFSALLGGFGSGSTIGGDVFFSNATMYGSWWSATLDHVANPIRRIMAFSPYKVDKIWGKKDEGYSVRCVKE